tara:strand:- start:374 stop:1372 length:999 start_codon:yes stop_codon:yes gene_type:complete
VSVATQLLFLLLIYGPALPLLMMLSNGAHFLPWAGGVALIVLAALHPQKWARGWIAASALLWLVTCVWLTVNRSNAWTAPPTDNGQTVGPIRIISFNAWLALHDPEAAARWVMEQKADVVILMEVGWRSRVLLTQLALHYPYVVTCRGSRACSTVILSRRMPTEMRGLAKGDADNRRGLSAAMMRFPDYTLVAVHLSQPWPMAKQQEELALLRDALRGIPRHHLVVAGDYNATAWSMTMRDAASSLRLKIVAPDEAASWPAPASKLPLPTLFDLDHVLLGTGWRAARMQRGPALGSDHYPYVITLGRYQPLISAVCRRLDRANVRAHIACYD